MSRLTGSDEPLLVVGDEILADEGTVFGKLAFVSTLNADLLHVAAEDALRQRLLLLKYAGQGSTTGVHRNRITEQLFQNSLEIVIM